MFELPNATVSMSLNCSKNLNGLISLRKGCKTEKHQEKGEHGVEMEESLVSKQQDIASPHTVCLMQDIASPHTACLMRF